MNKTVRLLACSLVTLLVAGLMPGAMAAADGEYGDYHGPDVQVVNRIITENNFGFEGSTTYPLWEVWQEGDTEPPSSWGNRVWWDEDAIPKRVVYIELWAEDTYGSGLVDLRGLDFLQAFVLGYSGITGVNANGLSRLERFGFHANPEMIWLGSEGLSALKRFLCSDCVKLAGIDLADSPDLFELQCLNGQSLASLNLGNLQKVKSIALSNTRLSSLDVSRITDLEELYCWSGILSSLTLGTLPNLIDLDCTDKV